MKGKPVIAPVYQTATYYFDTSDDMIDVVQNRSGYLYSRWDNPSVRHVEDMLAVLEKYEHALGFSSGMAAITTAIMSHVKAGDRIVSLRESYGGTFELLNKLLPGFGVETVFLNCWDLEGLFKEIKQGLSILYLETPTNPLLRVVDVASLAEAAHAKGALVMLDSTFATPVNQHPVDWGVDVVIHSATKYLGGHHDITAGFACCHAACFEKIWDYRKILGGVMDPDDRIFESPGGFEPWRFACTGTMRMPCELLNFWRKRKTFVRCIIRVLHPILTTLLRESRCKASGACSVSS